MVKAIEAFPHTGPLANVEGWLFRIAHNAALDFLRRRARREGVQDGDEALETIADPDSEIERRQAAAASLRTLMRLPVAQRSSVILMDVLGHSLEEISEVLESTVPAVKANLHRGRQRLVELAAEPDDRPPPVLAEADRQRLAAYVARFNARDFDALRAQLADDVKVEVVNRTRLVRPRRGRPVLRQLQPDGRLASRAGPGRGQAGSGGARALPSPAGLPLYFMLIDWQDGRLLNVRDFRYARYVVDGAELSFNAL